MRHIAPASLHAEAAAQDANSLQYLDGDVSIIGAEVFEPASLEVTLHRACASDNLPPFRFSSRNTMTSTRKACAANSLGAGATLFEDSANSSLSVMIAASFHGVSKGDQRSPSSP